MAATVVDNFIIYVYAVYWVFKGSLNEGKGVDCSLYILRGGGGGNNAWYMRGELGDSGERVLI
jgi:hypothetical protein